jgi:leucyl aminopeptidase
MYLFPRLSSKIKSANSVYLLASKKDTDQLKLDKAQKAYITKALKADGFVVVNEFGNMRFYCEVKNLADDGNKETLRHFGHRVFEAAKDICEDLQLISSSARALELFSEGFALSSYRFDRYFTKPKKRKLNAVYVTDKTASLGRVETIVDATAWARELVNEPVSFLNATQLSKAIREKCKGTSISVEVLGKAKIKSLKMGGLLAVNQGSLDQPTFTILEYKPKNAKNKKPVVLVGKGVVYDTGGLSLKPTKGSMDSMKCDMAGAAAMAATILAAEKLDLPVHLIGLIPATDNRPGGNAYAPGDVVTMYDGTTVEVLNTDAEGRMILADALSYAKKYKPELVIDAATLTGAAAAAIGPHASIAMGNASQQEMDRLIRAGFAVHDRVVQFPFWSEYLEPMKSTIADLKNIGGSYAGMITAGKFLEHFTDYPYIHIDIAGPAFNEARDSYRGLGGTGAAVRLLVEFLSRK